MATGTTHATTAPAAAAPEDRSVRTGTVLVLAGIAAEYAVTQLHPSHEDPDDHAAVFPEYAASDDWIAVHLGQFAAGLLVLLGILILPAGLRSAGAAAWAGGAAAVVAAAVLAILQAVDGVALEQAVDSLAAVPDHLRDASFHDAEGMAVSSGIFSGSGLPGLVAWALLIAFAVVTAAAAWRRAGPVARPGRARTGTPAARPGPGPTPDRGVGR